MNQKKWIIKPNSKLQIQIFLSNYESTGRHQKLLSLHSSFCFSARGKLLPKIQSKQEPVTAAMKSFSRQQHKETGSTSRGNKQDMRNCCQANQGIKTKTQSQQRAVKTADRQILEQQRRQVSSGAAPDFAGQEAGTGFAAQNKQLQVDNQSQENKTGLHYSRSKLFHLRLRQHYKLLLQTQCLQGAVSHG